MAPKNTATKAAPRKRTTVAKAIGLGASDSDLLVGTIADANTKNIPDADWYYYLYKKHPTIRSCVRIIGNAVAQSGYSVGQIDGDDTQPLKDNDPREKQIREFFRGAFVPKTFRAVCKATIIDLLVYGNAYWKKNKAGKLLTNLERLDARLIIPKLNTDATAVDHYEVRKATTNGSGVVVTQGSTETLQPDELVVFALDEGGDAVLGSPSPLEALDLTTAMDLNIRKHRNSFFKNGATVGNVLINEDADEDAMRSAEKQLISMKIGAGNAYKNLLLPGSWKIEKLMESGKQELDFVKSTEIVRDEICSVYNVPPGKLLAIAGAMGQAGKGEDDETFEQECVLPLEELLYETITGQVLQGEFGIEDLELVPKRRNALRYDRILSAVNMVKAGATGNEARAVMGLATSDVEGMDEPLFLSATAGNIGQDEPVDPAQAQSEELNAANTNQDANEVAAKARPRFRWY